MAELGNYFAENLDTVFYLLAIFCAAFEVKFSKHRGPLTFIAIGASTTAICISLGLITHFGVALVMFTGFSVATAGLLWEYFHPAKTDDGIAIIENKNNALSATEETGRTSETSSLENKDNHENPSQTSHSPTSRHAEPELESIQVDLTPEKMESDYQHLMHDHLD